MKRASFSPSSFYASPSTPRDIKRIKRLEVAAKNVELRRASDALSQIGNGSIVSGHTKVYKVYSRQSDALEAADSDHHSGLKVFAFEVDSCGKRQFVTCHPEQLWTFYKDLPKRHYYEVIPQNKPCKLFFDLEYSKLLNPNVDGPAMTAEFKQQLGDSLDQTFGRIPMSVVELDSTTEVKFSRHLIVKSHIFENIHQMKYYVQDFCEKLSASDSCFPKIVTNEQRPAAGLFVDQGVYTKNRNFRLFLSSKFGKETFLKLIHDGGVGRSDPKATFYDSLVTCVNSIHFLQFKDHEDQVVLQTHGSRGGCSAAASSSQSCSPFPEIDDFVASLVNDLETGRTGYVRKWVQNGSFLTYEIAGSYRYCHNIERHHKSNNVKFIVDIQHGNYFQMCHDENCKEFRSNVFQLPKSCQPWLALFE